MESPSYMTPLSQCWKLDRPTPDECKGKKRADTVKSQFHKYDTITKDYKVKKKLIYPSYIITLVIFNVV